MIDIQDQKNTLIRYSFYNRWSWDIPKPQDRQALKLHSKSSFVTWSKQCFLKEMQIITRLSMGWLHQKQSKRTEQMHNQNFKKNDRFRSAKVKFLIVYLNLKIVILWCSDFLNTFNLLLKNTSIQANPINEEKQAKTFIRWQTQEVHTRVLNVAIDLEVACKDSYKA